MFSCCVWCHCKFLWCNNIFMPKRKITCTANRALCRKKLLPVTHVLADTWMLTVKLVYKLSNVPDDPKWATNTHMTQFYTHFQGITNNIYGFRRLLFAPSCLTRSPPIHPYFYPSIFVFTSPNDGWTGLYIKL